MKLPNRTDWIKSIDVIMLAGATIYLLCLLAFMILAYINGYWTYVSDWGTPYEIVLVLIFISYFLIRMTIEARNIN